MMHQSNAVEYQYRLEWDFIERARRTHSQRDFTNLEDFCDWLKALQQGENRGWTENVQMFRRRIVTKGWKPFIP